MKSVKQFERCLKKYGNRIEVETETGTESGHAFVTPLRYKNKMYVDGYFMPQGYVDGGHYLYIGTPKIGVNVLTDGTKLVHSGTEYFVKRSEEYIVRGQCVYIWAILTPAGKET